MTMAGTVKVQSIIESVMPFSCAGQRWALFVGSHVRYAPSAGAEAAERRTHRGVARPAVSGDAERGADAEHDGQPHHQGGEPLEEEQPHKGEHKGEGGAAARTHHPGRRAFPLRVSVTLRSARRARDPRGSYASRMTQFS